MKNFEITCIPPLEIFFAGEVFPIDNELPTNLQRVLDDIKYGNGKLKLLNIEPVDGCLEITISRPFKEMIEGKYEPCDGLISLLDALIFSGYMNHQIYTLALPREMLELSDVQCFWINMLVPGYNNWVESDSWVRGLNIRTEAEKVTYIYDLYIETQEVDSENYRF